MITREQLVAFAGEPVPSRGTDDDLFHLGDIEYAALENSLAAYLAKVGIKPTIRREGDRTFFDLPFCPRKGPEHKAGRTAVILYRDGSIVLKCHHGQCADESATEAWRRFRRDRGAFGGKVNGGRFTWRTSAALAASDDTTAYIVDDIWPESQGGIISGRFKTLKTSVGADLAISAATGTPFLGRFATPNPVRVGFMSAESGWATLRERATAIARAKGLTLSGLSNLIWSADSPKLARAEHLDELRKFIKGEGLKGLLVDPTYLSLSDVGDSASNVFKMGAALAQLTELIADTGCSIILLNHNKKGRGQYAGQFDAPDLGDISMSGFAEWMRFWLLLGPRREWDETVGQHWLWLVAGGSAGHAGKWHLDVTEGRRSDPGGRRWEVSIIGATAGRQAATAIREAEKLAAKAKAQADDQAAILGAVKRLGAETKTTIRAATGFNSDRFNLAFAPLLAGGKIAKSQITKGARPFAHYSLAG